MNAMHTIIFYPFRVSQRWDVTAGQAPDLAKSGPTSSAAVRQHHCRHPTGRYPGGRTGRGLI